MSQRIIVRRDELFTPDVDEALQKQHALQGQVLSDASEVSPLRRVLMSAMFYLPVAGLLGGLVAWVILEPHFNDFTTVAGEVVLVNNDPFDISAEALGIPGAEVVSITVGNQECIVIVGETLLEGGVDGQAPFRRISDIRQGSFIEAAGEAVDDHRMLAMALRPAADGMQPESRTGQDSWITLIYFPGCALLIAMSLLLAEGIMARNWVRMFERLGLGILLVTVFVFVAYIPAGIAMSLGQLSMMSIDSFFGTVHSLPPLAFVTFVAGRSAAWACLGAALGLGLNLVRSTKAQLRNSVVGGALGGALGGVFFDPVVRFLSPDSAFDGAEASRLVGMMAVGLCVGVFLALVERLAREAWLRVRTGPLAGKSFVLYRSPTVLGSSPRCDVYLFKDAGIDGTHAAIQRVGDRYEIEDLGSRTGTMMRGQTVVRRRLTSGDQIMLGSTVLDFEERMASRDGGSHE
jgi:hypothetical protein